MTDRVWVMKYALTEGARECDVISEDSSSYTVDWSGGFNGEATFLKSDVVATFGAAGDRFQAMRDAKIKAHERAIERLVRMPFKVASDVNGK